jgi:hypothetical protein
MTSDFLFAQPSRLSGIARLLDLLCVFQLYNLSSSRPEADCRATFSDWVMVGGDLKRACDSYESQAESSPGRECVTAQP